MNTTLPTGTFLDATDHFEQRHIGPRDEEVAEMLAEVGYETMQDLIEATVPSTIAFDGALDLPEAMTEQEVLELAAAYAGQNNVKRSFIGMGYHKAVVPPVIQRNVLENPAWYTQYTPYQPEIAQGRLEALLNFQTLITDLTGLELAGASLLDEGTAAAEAMTLCYGVARAKRTTFLVAEDVHPQTIEVLKTRAEPMGIKVRVQSADDFGFGGGDVFGVLVQYPNTNGGVEDFGALSERAHEAGAMLVVAADLLSLTLLRAPGSFGADVAVGSTQRFGVPMGFGGPHAAYFATHEKHKRKLPGRLVGVTRDVAGGHALRLALQTREQHIRRDRATSNICTSQVLLAVIASMYAVYHGPDGLRRIAERVRGLTEALATGLEQLGVPVLEQLRFDTVQLAVSNAQRAQLLARAEEHGVELREVNDDVVSITLDEATTRDELATLFVVAAGERAADVDLEALARDIDISYPAPHARTSAYLTHETFNSYHSEHELLRYMYRLQQRDLSLTTSMIPLGSCTMKLNATAEMVPVTMPGFGGLHPFTAPENAAGYHRMIGELEEMLAEITGLPGVSLQPNAGSQGEYSGLLTIRAHHAARGEGHRSVCLIPSSAHGTNPASAVMAGMKVVVVACDELGNVDVADLEAKAEQHKDELAALMVTYPSTHGVFEEEILNITEIVHSRGGQVYMDGANINAQVGICRPGDFGIDVCHLNLHKTFCIPHGGGGPGVGPIAVAAHLKPYLPGHTVRDNRVGDEATGAVASAPWGSAGILPISWTYIRMMGAAGLKRATEVAILNANYMAKRLKDHYDLLYTGPQGTVAHEFILDLRPLRDSAGVNVSDVAKRLMDFGFHAPTMSWPVEGTLMIEPTESETKAELDRFVEAMIKIREEIREVEEGRIDREDNPLKMAPHTAQMVSATEWTHSYSREQAAYPAPWVAERKFWPTVRRVDDAFGDRNLFCTCPSPADFE
ncbi:MAG: aminomethyl-transferring glycine dehydrogenase [Myxococcota bacterium]